MDAFVIQSNAELGITMNFEDDDIPLEWKQNQKMKHFAPLYNKYHLVGIQTTTYLYNNECLMIHTPPWLKSTNGIE